MLWAALLKISINFFRIAHEREDIEGEESKNCGCVNKERKRSFSGSSNLSNIMGQKKVSYDLLCICTYRHENICTINFNFFIFFLCAPESCFSLLQNQDRNNAFIIQRTCEHAGIEFFVASKK